MQLWKVPRKTPLLAYINQEFVAIKRNCLDGTPVARRGAGLADSKLTSPRDPSALLREVPLPLFVERPPQKLAPNVGREADGQRWCHRAALKEGAMKDPRLVTAWSSPLEEYRPK